MARIIKCLGCGKQMIEPEIYSSVWDHYCPTCKKNRENNEDEEDDE